MRSLSRRDVTATKILDYLLSESHPIGREKAAFFQRYGFDAGAWEILKASLLDHPERNPVAAARTDFGTKYVVRCSIETPDRRNPCIVTVWMVEDGTETARLVTAYPAR